MLARLRPQAPALVLLLVAGVAVLVAAVVAGLALFASVVAFLRSLLPSRRSGDAAD